MVCNRLKVFGGAESYMFSVGDELRRLNHDVQYFGLFFGDERHGNSYGIYAKKGKTPWSIVQNRQNRLRFAKLLDLYKPDLIHAHLLYFTLTPSILVEAKKRNIPVIQTVHDGKIICPSYQMFDLSKGVACSECVDGQFDRCFRKKCMKSSPILSWLAYEEARINKAKGYYEMIDCFVFPSAFMRDAHLRYGLEESKTVVLRNYSRISAIGEPEARKGDYILFFGRITRVKGVELLATAIKQCPNLRFLIAGRGDLEKVFLNLPNCQMVGFLEGKELEAAISRASLSVFPSIWNENCPMGIAESIARGTPVIGASVGGIPEMIIDGYNGLLFEAGSVDDLVSKLQLVMHNQGMLETMSQNCISSSGVYGVDEYTQKLLGIYNGVLERAVKQRSSIRNNEDN